MQIPLDAGWESVRLHSPRLTQQEIRHIVFWDIDGTLLTTARAGVPALEDAAAAVTGIRPDLSTMATAGKTDGAIALAVLASLGAAGNKTERDRFLEAYASALPRRLREKRGR